MTFMKTDLKNMFQKTKEYFKQEQNNRFLPNERFGGFMYGVEFFIVHTNTHGYCSIRGIVQWFDNEDFEYEYEVVIPPITIAILPKDLDETRKFILDISISKEYKDIFNVTGNYDDIGMSETFDLSNLLEQLKNPYTCHLHGYGFIIMDYLT